MHMKKWLALLLSFLMLLPACGLAEESVNWLYSFSAGTVLSGDGMDGVREFLDAVQLSLTVQARENVSAGQAELLSYGKPAFTMRAELTGAGEMGIYCSLTGDNTLMCRKDQLNVFLKNILYLLEERSLLKGSALAQAESLADTAANVLVSIIESSAQQDLHLVLNPDAWLDLIGAFAAEEESLSLDGSDPECPGAVSKRTWRLSEADLNALVDAGIEKLKRIPLLSDEFEKGAIRIGNQAVTESFLRELFSAMQGDTVLEVFQNAEGQVLCMRLMTPDVSAIVDDPVFSQVQGIEFLVSRNESETDGKQDTLTDMRLLGLNESLISVRMEKGPGADIPSLPAKSVYQVGEMTAEELNQLISSLGLVIAGNAINMVMDLPRIVFDTLVDRLF